MNPIALLPCSTGVDSKPLSSDDSLKLTHSTVVAVTVARAKTELSAIPAFAFDACCSPSFGSFTHELTSRARDDTRL